MLCFNILIYLALDCIPFFDSFTVSPSFILVFHLPLISWVSSLTVHIVDIVSDFLAFCLRWLLVILFTWAIVSVCWVWRILFVPKYGAFRIGSFGSSSCGLFSLIGLVTWICYAANSLRQFNRHMMILFTAKHWLNHKPQV